MGRMALSSSTKPKYAIPTSPDDPPMADPPFAPGPADIRAPTDRESRCAMAGPAVAVNRFFVNVGPLARIAFAEQAGPGGEPQFRAAVAMTVQDAAALRDVLGQVLGKTPPAPVH